MLLIYIPKTSPRIEYVFELLFRHEWAIDYRTTSDFTTFENYQQEKINYSHSRHGDDFFIKASSLLFEQSIIKKEIIVDEKHETKVLFPNDESCNLGFDIFSAIFYMVSRYEEYLPFTPDEFGRFKAADSLAFQNNFLQKPVVNIWINIFKNILAQRFPSLKTKESSFRSIVTYDIDVAFKFKGRSILRTIGSTARDLLKFKLKNISQRILTLSNIQQDPWNVYDSLAETIQKNHLESIFFFLMADKTPNDRNLHHRHPLMKKLINQIKTFSEIGIHPSFHTSSFPEKIFLEKERLEKIADLKITKSRQHYLKFILPSTYNSLLTAGITEDYSMGFPEMPGFRAGICKPFYFYDLKKEKATELKIFPVSCMEGSFFKTDLPEQAFQKISNLIKEIKEVQGIFISIWHNHTISETTEFRDWKHIHDQMIQNFAEKF